MDKNLRKEALRMVGDTKISVLATSDRNTPWARFIEQAKVEDNFTFWYATAFSSPKIKQIKANPNVCVLILKDGQDLRIFGKAKVITDKKTKYAFWQDNWQTYFSRGRDDPEYVLLKIVPHRIEYRNRQKFGHLPKVI